MFVEPHGGKVVGFGEKEIEFKFSLDWIAWKQKAMETKKITHAY